MSTAGLSTAAGDTTNSTSRACHLCSLLLSMPPAPRFRPAPTSATTRVMTVAALTRLELWESIPIRRIERALRTVGLTLPACDSGDDQTSSEGLNKALPVKLSEFVRRTRMPLPQFAELLRGQTKDDYRPNKGMISAVLSATCAGYEHLPQLFAIAEAAAQVPLSQPLPPQYYRPRNHGSANERYAVLVRNIRKEQDAWRCIVVDIDILPIWTEVHISPFGVTKATATKATATEQPQAEVCQPDFVHCDAIATEISRQEAQFPGVDIAIQAGDVASAFKHVCIHSNSVHLFGGCLDRDTALVIDMPAAFGLSGSPGPEKMVGMVLPSEYSSDARAHVLVCSYSAHYRFRTAEIREGCGSGLPVRSTTITATLTGFRHFFAAAGLHFPSDHPQVRMLIKGISRLDTPVRHKAPVSIQLLEACYHSFHMEKPFHQALWGVLCLAFFFLLRRSEIAAANSSRFAWFSLKANGITVLGSSDQSTLEAKDASTVHIRLTGSKTNQQGDPTQRFLRRSGHTFLCPVLGALCLLKARRSLPADIPAAVYTNEAGVPECVSGHQVSEAIRQAAADGELNFEA